jgi:urease beta subunit
MSKKVLQERQEQKNKGRKKKKKSKKVKCGHRFIIKCVRPIKIGGAFHTFEYQSIISFDKSTKSQHINPLYYFKSLFQGIQKKKKKKIN